MSIGKTSLKATIVATSIFNTLILSKDGLEGETFIILIVSFVVLFCISIVVIILTIHPFYYLQESKGTSKKQIFNTYFPYYSMLLFLLLFAPDIYKNNIDEYTLIISTTTFFTAMFTWVWLFSEKTTQS